LWGKQKPMSDVHGRKGTFKRSACSETKIFTPTEEAFGGVGGLQLSVRKKTHRRGFRFFCGGVGGGGGAATKPGGQKRTKPFQMVLWDVNWAGNL